MSMKDIVGLILAVISTALLLFGAICMGTGFYYHNETVILTGFYLFIAALGLSYVIHRVFNEEASEKDVRNGRQTR